MKKFLIVFLCTFLAVPFASIRVSYAGDVMPAGTVLEADSYVFTMEEATNLMNRVIELESEVQELEKYKELEVVRTQQIDFYKLNESFYILQIDRYKDLDMLNRGLLDKYRKRDKLQAIENIGFLSLGIGLTIGSFLLADAANDLAGVTPP
jgi:hypothetical protein